MVQTPGNKKKHYGTPAPANRNGWTPGKGGTPHPTLTKIISVPDDETDSFEDHPWTKCAYRDNGLRCALCRIRKVRKAQDTYRGNTA